MALTRFKLSIGAFGLGLGGLAAVAAGPGQSGVSCTPVRVASKVPLEAPPVPVPAPSPADLPAPPVQALPPLPALEPANILPPPLPLTAPVPAPAPPPPPMPTPSLPPPTPVAVELPPLLPSLTLTSEPVSLPDVELPPKPANIDAIPSFGLPDALPPALPLPEPVVNPQRDLPPPQVDVTPVDMLAPRIEPTPVPVTPVKRTSPPAIEFEDARPTAIPPPAQTVERKLKVLLHMGDQRPHFDVRDADEVYLKVASDHVNVQAPGEGGNPVSTLRATGQVHFITPGGEGHCDELAVIPGTGQVIVSGNIAFTTNWGKVETTVTGDKMTFRLGSMPDPTRTAPTPTTPPIRNVNHTR